MKLDAARIVLRPRKLSELIDLGFRFAVEPAAGLYAKLTLAVLIPAWGSCMAARWAAGWDWGQVWLLAAALATVSQGLFTVAVGRLMFAQQVRVGEIVSHYVRRLPAYLAALVMSRIMLAAAGLLVVAIVPPLWMWSRVAFVHEVCLLEQAGPRDAIQRSARMGSRRAVNTIGMLLATSAAGLGFVFVAEALINAGLLEFVLQLGMPFGSLFDEGGSAAALLGLFVAVPYVATVRFLGYVDLRTRQDGWDVQLRFMAISTTATATATDTGTSGGST